jgi:AcrR family transcriptional regulator
MTEKQEKILESALELFAKEGFYATSTSKVAKHAGVSEGLIFRHFGNKDGLLQAILKEGEVKSRALFSDIVFATEPKEVLRSILSMMEGYSRNKEDFEFWKLQYKLKWETEQYNAHKMEPLKLALVNAFEKLGYDNPQGETQSLMLMMDGLATRLCLQEDYDHLSVIEFLKTKYQV